jgi:hypothetical protein
MYKKRSALLPKVILGLVVLALAAVGLYFVPPIHEKLAWRVDNLRTTIYYLFNPPQKVVFVPNQQSLLTQTATPVQTLPAAATPTITIPSISPTAQVTPTITSTPPPVSVILDNVTFIDQMHRWNYCGPANLAMALTYWGWQGEPGNLLEVRDEIAATVKPGIDDSSMNFVDRSQTDVNVMPYELVDYVNDHTTLRALWRVGGDIDLFKRLIAAGFPPIAEKGIYQTLPPENTRQWAGHYSFTTGYDEAAQEFIWQDSYTPSEAKPYKDQGYNQRMSYAEYTGFWRAFDYVFIVVYPPEREQELMQVLGPWADENWAAQHAAEIADQESQSLSGVDQFFALFNKGTSYGMITEYGQAALAYDQAFSLYSELPENSRPYRIMWYQTGPYKAYFYTSRYQDVITLANTTLDTIFKLKRNLEESLYWRAQAEYAIGEVGNAERDIIDAYHYNRNLQATLALMAQWGISP